MFWAPSGFTVDLLFFLWLSPLISDAQKSSAKIKKRIKALSNGASVGMPLNRYQRICPRRRGGGSALGISGLSTEDDCLRVSAIAQAHRIDGCVTLLSKS